MALQMAILLTYVDEAASAHDVFERGIHSCLEVFGPLTLPPEELRTFRDAVEYMGDMAWHPDHVIYIRVPPDVCYSRMLSRGREYERHSLQHLIALHEAHEAAVAKLAKLRQGKVYVVDGTMPAPEVAAQVVDIVSRLLGVHGVA